jgi:hypothetical protein
MKEGVGLLRLYLLPRRTPNAAPTRGRRAALEPTGGEAAVPPRPARAYSPRRERRRKVRDGRTPRRRGYPDLTVTGPRPPQGPGRSFRRRAADPNPRLGQQHHRRELHPWQSEQSGLTSLATRPPKGESVLPFKGETVDLSVDDITRGDAIAAFEESAPVVRDWDQAGINAPGPGDPPDGDSYSGEQRD